MNQTDHRVHELAQQTGRSTKDVLNAAGQLGIGIPSPSAPIGADDYRRLRQHLTRQSVARQEMLRERPTAPPQRTRPGRVGNNPFARPTPSSSHGMRPPDVARRPAADTGTDSPVTRIPTQHPGPQSMPRRSDTRRVPHVIRGNDPFAVGHATPRPPAREETIEEEVARLARSKRGSGRPRRPEPLTGLAAFIAEHTNGPYAHRDDDGVAREWADQWRKRWFPDDEATDWIRAGLFGNESKTAAQMKRLDWTPETLARSLPGGTVLAMVRGGGHTLEQIDALLQQQNDPPQ